MSMCIFECLLENTISYYYDSLKLRNNSKSDETWHFIGRSGRNADKIQLRTILLKLRPIVFLNISNMFENLCKKVCRISCPNNKRSYATYIHS